MEVKSQQHYEMLKSLLEDYVIVTFTYDTNIFAYAMEYGTEIVRIKRNQLVFDTDSSVRIYIGDSNSLDVHNTVKCDTLKLLSNMMYDNVVKVKSFVKMHKSENACESVGIVLSDFQYETNGTLARGDLHSERYSNQVQIDKLFTFDVQ